eukprot:GILJ01017529.1.p2 GENE.GILJ01017529.1~~GILJ01017529.1.p2  ORF type:complete len:147 (-),score=28.14 GILJ01017529.1:30-470(-)
MSSLSLSSDFIKAFEVFDVFRQYDVDTMTVSSIFSDVDTDDLSSLMSEQDDILTPTERLACCLMSEQDEQGGEKSVLTPSEQNESLILGQEEKEEKEESSTTTTTTKVGQSQRKYLDDIILETVCNFYKLILPPFVTRIIHACSSE